jgi:hypothetical protein
MSATRRFVTSGLAVVGALVLACAPYAPRGWLSTPEVAQAEAYGGWMRAEVRSGAVRSIAEGELIAVSPDSLYVLVGAAGLMALPTKGVVNAVVETYDSRAGLLGVWMLLGTASTVSNGVGLILTAPMWLLFGTIGISKATGAAQVQRSGSSIGDWAALQKFARFPQGLPPDLDRARLRPKPRPALSGVAPTARRPAAP